jgi:hypothetical protein
LIGHQETLMQNLFGTIIAMFEIEIGDVDSGEARKDDAYVQEGSHLGRGDCQPHRKSRPVRA